MASDVFAPPSDAELKMFAAPSDEELKSAGVEKPGLLSKAGSLAWEALTKGVPQRPGHESIEPTTAAQIMAPMVMGSPGMMNTAAGPITSSSLGNLPSALETVGPRVEALKEGAAAAGGGLMRAGKAMTPYLMRGAGYVLGGAGAAKAMGLMKGHD